MPRDIFPSPTTRSMVQELADMLGRSVREFNRLDSRPSKGKESNKDRDGSERIMKACGDCIAADQVKLLTQFPKNAIDAVMMLAVARNHFGEDCDDDVMTELGIQAVDRATAFLMEHLGVAGTDFSEYVFADYMRDRALGRDVEVRAPEVVA